MKKTLKRLFVLGAAVTFLGGQVVFATDPVQEQTQDKKQEQTTAKDCSDSKVKTPEKEKTAEQTQTGSDKAVKSGQ